MRIESFFTPANNLDPERKTNGARQQPADKSGLSDDVAQPGSMKDMMSALGKLPDVRQDRVEQLQAAIREGRYNVSNEQIAHAVFSELLGQK